MPKHTRWNVDHQHALLDPITGIVVAPGESYDFTDEQIQAGLAGSWSEEDPRAGLDAEREFKQRRDRGKQSATTDTTDTEPATEPEKE